MSLRGINLYRLQWLRVSVFLSFIFFIFVFLFHADVGAVEAKSNKLSVAEEESNDSYIMCRSQKTVRTIRVASQAENGCVTTYTKEGVDQQIAKSRKVQVCNEVMDNVKRNLEKANWICKDISNNSSVSEGHTE